jgi:GDSL-like Lipase/Acylhydrolase family
LLKTQVVAAFLPLGCTWTSSSGKHLGERIAMLGRPSLNRRGAIAGAAAVAVVGVGLGYAAWAQQPERLVTETAARPEAVWTSSSEAPEGTLSHQLEAQRHDYFIELAQAGDIDLVFFGTTEAEMWWWPNRGRSVWDRAFGSIKAANFGSQGTQPASLLWRMRNGELDGYQAKLIVLQAGRTGDVGNDGAEFVESYAALINEIRVRQPQAKILLFAPLPRGESLEAWRQRAQVNAAVFAELVDDETVFYTDIGDRFYLSDGSFNGASWSNDANNRGTQTSAFEIWAEELQPWLDRFVR